MGSLHQALLHLALQSKPNLGGGGGGGGVRRKTCGWGRNAVCKRRQGNTTQIRSIIFFKTKWKKSGFITLDVVTYGITINA